MLKFPKAQISRHPVHLFDLIRPPRDFNPPIRRIDVKSIDLPEERALFPGWFRLISYPVLRRRREITVAPPGRETDTRGSGSETVVISSSSTTDDYVLAIARLLQDCTAETPRARAASMKARRDSLLLLLRRRCRHRRRHATPTQATRVYHEVCPIAQKGESNLSCLSLCLHLNYSTFSYVLSRYYICRAMFEKSTSENTKEICNKYIIKM